MQPRWWVSSNAASSLFALVKHVGTVLSDRSPPAFTRTEERAAAARLNNLGANLLEKDDFQSACGVLCTALKVVRGQCSPDSSRVVSTLLVPKTDAAYYNKNYSSSSSTSASSSCRHRRGTKRRASQNASKKGRETLSEISSSSRHQHHLQDTVLPLTPDFVFRIPMRLEVSSRTEKEEDSCECSIFSISSAILFNLGLAQFLRATEEERINDSRSPSRLVVALQMFEMVYALEDSTIKNNNEEENNKNEPNSPSATAATSDDDDGLPFLHLLGLVNNCAQLRKRLNQIERADHLFQHILTSLMMLAISSLDKQENENISSTGALEGFFAATSHLVLRDACVAEAA
jgi:hypothetical protein